MMGTNSAYFLAAWRPTIKSEYILSVFLLSSLVGCQSRVVTACEFNEERVFRLMEASPTFEAYKERLGGKYSYIVETLNSSEAMVEIGQMLTDRFENDLTLKVLVDGTICRYDLFSKNDDVWKLDYAPISEVR